MKYILSLLALTFFLSTSTHAQSNKTVTWSYETKKINDKEFDLVFKATIKKGIHMYSQHIGEGGPIPTSFTFKPDAGYARVDSVIEKSKPVIIHDAMFDMQLTYFFDEAIFVQHVKLTGSVKTISGSLEFMSCDETKCFPPETVNFEFKLP